MRVIQCSFSQSWDGFMNQTWSKTPQFVTTEWDISSPLIVPNIMAPINILKHDHFYCTSYLLLLVGYRSSGSKSMLTIWTPPQTVHMGWHGGSGCWQQQRSEGNSGSSVNCVYTATGNDSWCGKYTDQYPTPYGDGIPPSQQPFAGTLQFNHQSPFNMTHSLQPITSTSQWYPSYESPWQEYNFHAGGDGGCQRFAHQQ